MQQCHTTDIFTQLSSVLQIDLHGIYLTLIFASIDLETTAI